MGEVDPADIDDADQDVLADPVERDGASPSNGNAAIVQMSVTVRRRNRRYRDTDLRVGSPQCLSQLDRLDALIFLEIGKLSGCDRGRSDAAAAPLHKRRHIGAVAIEQDENIQLDIRGEFLLLGAALDPSDGSEIVLEALLPCHRRQFWSGGLLHSGRHAYGAVALCAYRIHVGFAVGHTPQAAVQLSHRVERIGHDAPRGASD